MRVQKGLPEACPVHKSTEKVHVRDWSALLLIEPRNRGRAVSCWRSDPDRGFHGVLAFLTRRRSPSSPIIR